MKQWDAADWGLIILASTIPITVIGLIIMRIITGQGLSDNAAAVIKDITTIVGGGVISIISARYALKKFGENTI